MNSKMKSTMLTVAILLGLGSCAQLPKGATAVTQFDADRYLGKWYEIARFDFRFGCSSFPPAPAAASAAPSATP